MAFQLIPLNLIPTLNKQRFFNVENAYLYLILKFNMTFDTVLSISVLLLVKGSNAYHTSDGIVLLKMILLNGTFCRPTLNVENIQQTPIFTFQINLISSRF